MTYDLHDKRIYVAGHGGLVGSALVRRLERENSTVLTADRQVDLREQAAVRRWFDTHRPDAVFLAAAKVGGIGANKLYPAQFIYDNLMIEANVIDAAWQSGVEKLLFLGSSCIYPKFAAQPIIEEALLSGPLEPTNEWYAVAKIAGIKLCQAYRREYGCDFISAMPTNLYGPGDNFDLNNSHVLPALIRKAHEAKISGQQELIVWGTGSPRREFLYVDDLAAACVAMLKGYSDEGHLNIGTGTDCSILEITQLVVDVVGFDGKIVHDLSKPDGTPRKLLSSDKIRALGWKPETSLEEGIRESYRWFLSQMPTESRGI